MGSFSIWHWIIVLAIVLLLFGRGKIPELMGDVAKGIKSFKKGISEDDDKDVTSTASTVSPKTVDHKGDEIK
ncbi:twin-arginine translocase TatA/TatE family subunit [Rhizobium sp. G187]|uniref:twin-arginine translocase TatA/TatE family subunit n=1 Tax=unclassified Rhizobium TaxID=2613769 RepID=UPI0006B8ADAD|nr:twin-arginine translocase TatA/TatE family subunit [Rhizobium sp. AAP43]KPF41799.1 preprotein translocase subunit TatA [Rhizobium sp. AAP43]